MKIFVINLKRSQGRRQRIEKHLKKLNLDYELFEAIDGYKLTEDQIKSYVDPHSKYSNAFIKPTEYSDGFVSPFKPAEIGCFLSHYRIYEKICNDKLEYALILEDDIDMSDHLPNILSEIEEKHIKQGEIISLFANFLSNSELYTYSNLNNDYSIIKPSSIKLSAGTTLSGTVAYIITYATACKFVKELIPMHTVIYDWGFYFHKELIKDYKIVFPNPVEESGEYSDIHESYGGILLKLKKALIEKFPIIGNLILKKRKFERRKHRFDSITIDGKRPSIIFK